MKYIKPVISHTKGMQFIKKLAYASQPCMISDFGSSSVGNSCPTIGTARTTSWPNWQFYIFFIFLILYNNIQQLFIIFLISHFGYLANNKSRVENFSSKFPTLDLACRLQVCLYMCDISLVSGQCRLQPCLRHRKCMISDLVSGLSTLKTVRLLVIWE